MKKLFFIEYMQEGSGVPVDCTAGIKTRLQGVEHGRKVSVDKRYCGFWILAKPPVKGVDPIRLEFHPVSLSPGGNATFGKPVFTNRNNEVDAMCVGQNRAALRKRLNEAKSVLKDYYLRKFKGATFDFELKRLTTKDGALALQWLLRSNPCEPEAYENQQTAIGTVQLIALKPEVIG